MRAWRLHDTDGPDSYRLDEIPDPEPGPGEVRIAMRISALNHLDLWMSKGLPRPEHLPHITGADGAGVIDAVGEGVDPSRVGEEVIINPSTSCGTCPQCLAGEIVFCRRFGILGEHSPGTLAERTVVPAVNAVPKPPHLDWETAGSFGLATGTAYRMLRRARLRAGEVLLVVGVGGGVSSAAALLGRAMGARVFVTSRRDDKIAWAVERGAEGGFASDSEFSKELKAKAGRGADVVVENVGPATWDQSLRSLAPGGRVVVCGSTSGTKVELSMPVLFFKQLEVIGSTMFTHGEFNEVLDLVARGVVDPPVTTFPFDRLPEALALLEAGDQLGKVALTHA
ncbi:MAG: alcohol dehydrogenase [Acidimicrobiia bacterium]|nr:MAG: alcohol dehydrogenase [Acidimicrobiia bacterium]